MTFQFKVFITMRSCRNCEYEREEVQRFGPCHRAYVKPS